MTMNSNYQPDVISEEIQQKVKQISNNKCYRCHRFYKKKQTMHLHHLDFNEKNKKYGNLIYLCYHCHKAIHRASFRPMGWNKSNYSAHKFKKALYSLINKDY